MRSVRRDQEKDGPMKLRGRKLLVCDCEKTMPLSGERLADALRALGAEGELPLHTQLCRAQLQNYEAALNSGEPLLVACTQEAPLFSELAEEERPDADLRFANIRETAGWGEEGAAATAKMAALLAAATQEAKPAPLISLKSEGVCLIYGKDERALEVAAQLKGRLDVTVLLREAEEIAPPRIMDVPVFLGRIVAAKGYLGGFGVTVDGYAPASPSSRERLAFDAPRDGAYSECDLILDLTGGTPLFPAGERLDGYLRADPADPVAVQRAALAASDLVGEFEKPRYVRYDAEICAHGRNRKTGCRLCLDNCPLSAITSLGESVEIDPHVCGGCGLCAALCPTGAIEYQFPAATSLFEQTRSLLESYRKAGGEAPVLLLHDERYGAEVISLMARHGGGLPARVLPLPVNEVTELGFDFYFDALAWGAAQIALLVAPEKRDDVPALAGTLGLVETVMDGLGYGGGRIHLLDQQDPDAVEAALRALPSTAGAEAGLFLPMGGKRARAFLGLHHLHAKAPQPVDQLPLPQGAPFGTIHVDTSGCTLCQACVTACPAGALIDDPEMPWLGFIEENCVQCGLCKVTCPEKVIALEPRLNFQEEARTARELNRATPFNCIRCGKPFGVGASIERIVDRLAGAHSMFQDSGRVERIMMCDDCRVVTEFEASTAAISYGERPAMRTTEDDLRERELDRAKQRLAETGRNNGSSDS